MAEPKGKPEPKPRGRGRGRVARGGGGDGSGRGETGMPAFETSPVFDEIGEARDHRMRCSLDRVQLMTPKLSAPAAAKSGRAIGMETERQRHGGMEAEAERHRGIEAWRHGVKESWTHGVMES